LYLHLHVTRRLDDEITVRYTGVNPERVSTDRTNLVVRTILDTLESCHKRRGFDLEIENHIPVGVGLGSSAAAIVGALAICHWLADLPLDDEELIYRATRLEGHPDNVAAAWHGGFTVALTEKHRVLAYSCPVPASLKLVLVVPDYALPTEKARAVLPAAYSRADAVYNMQRTAALTAQLFSGRAEFNRALFDDRWHQPYRAPLVPGLTDVLALKHPDLLGVCLSGAGPSILAFARLQAPEVGELIREMLARNDVESQVHLLAADNAGAKSWSLPAEPVPAKSLAR
jgi:homoserine kinase